MSAKADRWSQLLVPLVSSRNHLSPLARMCGVRGHLFLRDKVVPVLAFLEATESHLCARNVFLGVFKVLELRRLLSCY